MIERIQAALIDAVLAGAAAVLDVRRAGNLKPRLKTARELVTKADERSDAAILSVFRNGIAAIDPEISFHLEESGIHGSGNERRVGADPLDGTNHFACGGAMYAVQAHYVEDGVPVAGVVMQPEVYLPNTSPRHPLAA